MNVNIPEPLSLQGNLAQNWKTFSQNFSNYLLATDKEDAEDKKKIALLLNIVGQDGVDLSNTFKLSEADKVKFDKVIEAFVNYTTPKKNTTYERYIFFGRNQKTEETYNQYVTELRKLAKSCDFGTLEDSLIKDKLISGILSDKVRESLLRVEDLDLATAIKNCKIAERSKTQAALMNGHSSTTEDKLTVDEIRKFRKNLSFKPKRSQQKRRQNAVHANASQSSKAKDEIKCKYCGNQHVQDMQSCPAFGKKCAKCKKYNHFASVCNAKTVQHLVEQNEFVEDSDTSTDESDIAFLDEIKSVPAVINSLQTKRKEWRSLVKVENVDIDFKLDIGADVNVIPWNVFKKIKTETSLNPPSKYIEAFGGSIIKPMGQVKLNCATNNKTCVLEFLVVKSKSTPLLGIEACQILNLVQKVNEICEVSSNKAKFIQKNERIFTGLGKIPGKEKINIVKNATLPNFPPKRVPSSMKRNFKRTLQKLVKKGVIKKVRKLTSDHCINNLVVVEKDNGDLRFCLDPQDLNKLIITPHHLMPTISEIAEKLQHNKFYSVFDLKEGYHHLELDEASSNLCCFATPYGTFKYVRFPYGLCCGSETFQGKMESIFGDIPNVMVYQDDILVYGKTEQEHDQAVSHNRKSNQVQRQI